MHIRAPKKPLCQVVEYIGGDEYVYNTLRPYNYRLSIFQTFEKVFSFKIIE